MLLPKLLFPVLPKLWAAQVVYCEHQTEVCCQKRHHGSLICVVVKAYFNSWGQRADFKVLSCFIGCNIMALGTLLGDNN